MAMITVKDIPDELYERLKSVAEINQRSIDKEIIICIRKAIGEKRINVEEFIQQARQIRQLTADHPIDDEEFNRAKREGRL